MAELTHEYLNNKDLSTLNEEELMQLGNETFKWMPDDVLLEKYRQLNAHTITEWMTMGQSFASLMNRVFKSIKRECEVRKLI